MPLIFESFRNLFKIPELRTKLKWTAIFLIIYRIGSHIPIPGVRMETLDEVRKAGGFVGGEVLGGILNLFSTISGGALGNCALFSLGIMPYISASIIFSLLAKVIPSLEELSKEGPQGQKKINEYTRYATIPLCIIQGFMIVKLLRQPIQGNFLVPPEAGIGFNLLAVITLTAGTIFLMWLGEQITEYGIGNGISLLIMAGIVARMPYQVGLILKQGAQAEHILNLIMLCCLFFIIVGAVVYITLGQVQIKVNHPKLIRGKKVLGGMGDLSYRLPLKVNQAGVMPVIFASSLMVFPMTIVRLLAKPENVSAVREWFAPGSFWYFVLYILLIYFFSYFWTSLMFQPQEMAKHLKEHGHFIQGRRPGGKTRAYLEKVMTNITFVGAGFLAAIALMPQFVALLMGLRGFEISFAYNLGGTSILIVVGVVLDLVQKLETHLLERHYYGFLGKNKKMRGR